MANEKQITKTERKRKGIVFSLITVLLAILLLLLLLGGLFYLTIKNNIGGIAENNRELICEIPVLRTALPMMDGGNDEEIELTEEQVRKRYKQLLDDYENIISENEKLDEEFRLLKVKSEQNEAKIIVMEDQKAEFEKQKAALKEEQEAFLKEVAQNDKSGFISYYENMDAEIAASIYKEFVVEEKTTADKKTFAKFYEEMKPAAAAGIFENMGETHIDTILEILNNMEIGSAADIIQAMSSEFASLTTSKLADIYIH